ncbi:MAG: DUF4013 domain-containing protein [Methanobacteriaceae archaeon]|nr:DUF4013 domain-containing protein [Methanobacteriaceae archaeon]
MDIVDIFKESLYFPTKDLNKLVILGVIFIISNIPTFLLGFGLSLDNFDPSGILSLIFGILSLIVSIYLFGYFINMLRNTIDYQDELPEFNDFSDHIVVGIKGILIAIFYFIIPTIIAFILAFVTGAFGKLGEIVMLNGQAIPDQLVSEFLLSSSIAIILSCIIFIIFSLLYIIALVRFADKGNMGAAVEFGEVFKTIGNIGWGKYIVWYILMGIVGFFLAIISGILIFIPIIGVIINILIIRSYSMIFTAKATGLIYNEKDN